MRQDCSSRSVSDSIAKFSSSLRNYIESASRVAILIHSNADVDAVVSACVLANAISGAASPSISIIVPEGVAVEARPYLEVCNESIRIELVKRNFEPEFQDLCIVIDTASRVQLKTGLVQLDKCRNVAVIDHHESRDIEGALLLVDPQASSTAELVYYVVKELGHLFSKKELEALLAGIIYDTKRFLRGTPQTFRAVAEIIESGAEYQSALSVQSISASARAHTSKLARIKCLLRHRGFKLYVGSEQLYVALSAVGAYESDCASALVSLGYDIAFVVTEDESIKAFRVVYRALDSAVDKLGVGIYEGVLKKLVGKFGGGGGGHKTAGAAVVMAPSEADVIKELIAALSSTVLSSMKELAEPRVGESVQKPSC